MRSVSVSVVVAILLGACSFSPSTSGTPTSPLPTANPPTPTSAAILVTEALTPPDTMTVDMGRYYVYAGEYSFVPYFGYGFQTTEGNTVMGNADRTLSIGITGGAEGNVDVTSDEALTRYFLDAVFARNGSYSITSSKLIFIDDTEGTWFELAGMMSDEDFLGSAAAVRRGEGHYFFAFGIGKSRNGNNAWDEEGKQVFATLLDSIQFLSAEEMRAAGRCNISSDPTYGYSKDNPIRVGGDAFGGPSRERAYLDSLSGPNGEAISYSRNGSLNYGGTILDEFSLSYAGIPQAVTIYIDEYSFAELSAPNGFDCYQQFPLNPP